MVRHEITRAKVPSLAHALTIWALGFNPQKYSASSSSNLQKILLRTAVWQFIVQDTSSMERMEPTESRKEVFVTRATTPLPFQSLDVQRVHTLPVKLSTVTAENLSTISAFG